MSDKMDVVHEAAVGFLATLRDRDRGAVVTFGDHVNIAQPLTGIAPRSSGPCAARRPPARPR